MNSVTCDDSSCVHNVDDMCTDNDIVITNRICDSYMDEKIFNELYMRTRST